MKSMEELNALKKEIDDLKLKLKELTPEELAQVSGGSEYPSKRLPDGKVIT